MTEFAFVDYIKGYVDNNIDIPAYVKDVIKSSNLDPIKIYKIGLEYLRKGLVCYAEPILKTVGVSINNA